MRPRAGIGEVGAVAGRADLDLAQRGAQAASAVTNGSRVLVLAQPG
jgi:hypothetical protein